mmetsp:Transcript_98271/g.174147  ORF Transcript_98271/g.174147 Transcript_98271/m.174147 type:complete len:659 (-) Transcript_98271:116-2092(-)
MPCKMLGFMRAIAVIFTACLTAATMATSSRAGITAIQKVIELLKDMKVQAEADMKDEATKFAKFEVWCGQQKETKGKDIKQAESDVASLTASIELGESTITKLDEKMIELKDRLGKLSTESDKMTAVREEEASNYRATAGDLQESLDALAEALKTLKAQQTDDGAAASLLQVQKLSLLPAESRNVLTDFLQTSQDGPAYEFKSSNIVSMMADLQDQFSKEKMDVDEKEKKQAQAYNVAIEALNKEKKAVTMELGIKEKEKSETAQKKASAEGDLADRQQTLEEDSKYLSDTTALCEMKKADMAKRTETRTEEISTIGKVIEIISGKAVSGGKAALISTPVKMGVAFVQLQGKSQRRSPQETVAAFLEQRARLQGSRLLAQAAHSAQSDPFEKVMKMIQDLIIKLQEEATAETEQKGYCDKELAENGVRQETKTAEKESLETKIEELEASIAKLVQENAELSTEVKSLTDAIAKATSDREESKANNEKTIKEAKAAEAAVQDALKLLQEFYEKSAEATAFAQQPDTFSTPYKGMQGEGGGVIGLLEVIASDFTKLEMETSTEEAQEASEYSKYMSDASQDKAVKETTLKNNAAKKIDQEGDLQSDEEDLRTVKAQLEEAKESYAKLKPMCVDTGITYGERKAQRETEIQSLEEAIKLLK